MDTQESPPRPIVPWWTKVNSMTPERTTTAVSTDQLSEKGRSEETPSVNEKKRKADGEPEESQSQAKRAKVDETNEKDERRASYVRRLKLITSIDSELCNILEDMLTSQKSSTEITLNRFELERTINEIAEFGESLSAHVVLIQRKIESLQQLKKALDACF